MPTSDRSVHDIQNSTKESDERLRTYVFHGMTFADRGTHAVAACPFCGREGKFSVDISTRLWRCFVCAAGTSAGGGNGLVFTRTLYEQQYSSVQSYIASVRASAGRGGPGGSSATRGGVSPADAGQGAAVGEFLAGVATDRGLLSPSTVAAWGVCQAQDGSWLVPGYGADMKLDQVYRRTRVRSSGGDWEWRLLPTPGIWPEGKVHALHLPVGDFDLSASVVDVFEGWSDGAAATEVREVLGSSAVLAVPGCNAWRQEWTDLCRGKRVRLWFDSDHPREVIKGRVSRAGYDGMVRVAKHLSGAAESVQWLCWGPDGYDPDKPSGWDVRDHLIEAGGDRGSRASAMAALLAKLQEAPREWFNKNSVMVNGHACHSGSVESEPCSTFRDCEVAWEEATAWRQDLSDVMSVLLSVCASTQRAGNQLFFDLVGSPGSLKTTMCRALLVSGHCIHLENVTKILSGFKKPGEPEEDCSFLARANGRTWVTCEFDVMANLAEYPALMSKMRRIFDGETSTTYANDNKDRIYSALRTPWIRAGTPKMLDKDQSQLGDRFLRYILLDPDRDQARVITRAALKSERRAMMEEANSRANSIIDAKTRRAYSLTGGYVDWLRANVDDKLSTVYVDDLVEDQCIDLAEFSADMRARPVDERKKLESFDVKELPTRLSRQLVRLCTCLAVVLNKSVVDRDIMRVVRRVALDTSSGTSLNIVRWLSATNPKAGLLPYQESGGLGNNLIQSWTGMTEERLAKYTLFLTNIGVIEWRSIGHSQGAWFMTERVYELYNRIMGV